MLDSRTGRFMAWQGRSIQRGHISHSDISGIDEVIAAAPPQEWAGDCHCPVWRSTQQSLYQPARLIWIIF